MLFKRFENASISRRINFVFDLNPSCYNNKARMADYAKKSILFKCVKVTITPAKNIAKAWVAFMSSLRNTWIMVRHTHKGAGLRKFAEQKLNDTVN